MLGVQLVVVHLTACLALCLALTREPMLQWLRSSRRADDDKTYQMVVQRPGRTLVARGCCCLSLPSAVRVECVFACACTRDSFLS